MIKTKAPNPIDRHIGARIRMRRQQLGISQETLGRHLELTFQQVQKYEKGTNRVGGSRMAQIAEFLQVEVGFFYFNSPRPSTASGEARRAQPDSTMDEFMASRDGLMIAQAFVCIPNPQVRAAIAHFVRKLSAAETPKQVTLMAAE